MPELVFDKILFFSSEVKNFPADNLLRRGEFKKWKCAPGESKAVVVLQLKEANNIEKIHIGNEGSAFVEVFVGKSGTSEDDFQVILAASSFLTPMESRNNQNLSKVRFFDKEHLLKTALSQKWDIVKVVCTQPFNKSLSYGLSFIVLHSSPAADQPSNSLGAFTMKSDDQKSSTFKVGSLFERNRQKQLTDSVPATIKDETAKLSDTNEQQRAMAGESTKSISQESISRKRPATNSATNSATNVTLNSTPKESQSSLDLSSPPPKKVKPQERDLKSLKVEFSSIMKGVVVVLSGFQNPLRGELRDKVVSMGGKYKADWEKDCTHLVCAFNNTPKYNQVKGLGKIVKKEWIIECFDRKQMLPWRDYRLGTAPSPTKPKSESKRDVVPLKTDPKDQSIKSQNKNDDNVFDASTDSEIDEDLAKDRRQEVEKLKTKEGLLGKSKSKSKDDLLGQLSELPNFLRGLKFFLYGEFLPEDRKCIRRYITAYDGSLLDYMDSCVTTVITYEKWDESFDQALEDNSDLVFIHPDWLIDCFEGQKLLSFGNHEIRAD